MNKEEEKVLLDLIDELIAELDVTCTDANILTKSEAKSAISVLGKWFVFIIVTYVHCMKTNTEIIFFSRSKRRINLELPFMLYWMFIILELMEIIVTFSFDIMFRKLAKLNLIVDGLYKIHHMVYRIWKLYYTLYRR